MFGGEEGELLGLVVMVGCPGFLEGFPDMGADVFPSLGFDLVDGVFGESCLLGDLSEGLVGGGDVVEEFFGFGGGVLPHLFFIGFSYFSCGELVVVVGAESESEWVGVGLVVGATCSLAFGHVSSFPLLFLRF